MWYVASEWHTCELYTFIGWLQNDECTDKQPSAKYHEYHIYLHYTDGLYACQCKCIHVQGLQSVRDNGSEKWIHPTNIMVNSTNARLMLGQRRRRWPNINTALVECTIFIEHMYLKSIRDYGSEYDGCNFSIFIYQVIWYRLTQTSGLTVRPDAARCISGTIPANTKRWPNVGIMLDERCRRWDNIKPAFVQRLVLAGIVNKNT